MNYFRIIFTHDLTKFVHSIRIPKYQWLIEILVQNWSRLENVPKTFFQHLSTTKKLQGQWTKIYRKDGLKWTTNLHLKLFIFFIISKGIVRVNLDWLQMWYDMFGKIQDRLQTDNSTLKRLLCFASCHINENIFNPNVCSINTNTRTDHIGV